MKYVIEFGNRGGLYIDNVIVGSRVLVAKMASAIATTYIGHHNDVTEVGSWILSRGEYRRTWRDNTHFVAVSKLDGVDRGPASSTLWRMDTTAIFPGSVLSHPRESSHL